MRSDASRGTSRVLDVDARRLRWALLALAAMISLLLFVGVQWNAAVREKEVARSRELAMTAQTVLQDDPELAVRLAIEAAGAARTAEAEGTLRMSLLQFPLRVVMRGHGDEIRGVAFSPDGKTIATASIDHTARLWDAATGQALAELDHDDQVYTVAYSPDSRFVVTSSEDETARVFEVPSGKSVAVLRGHTLNVWAAVFGPDGKAVVTVSLDETGRLWDASTWGTIAILRGHTSGVDSVAFSPDGALLLSVSRDGTTRLWDARTGDSLRVFDGHAPNVTPASFSPDGKSIVLPGACGLPTRCDPTVRIWDVSTGERIAELRGHARAVNSAAFSPDGQFIVTASDDETVLLWDSRTRLPIAELSGHGDAVKAGFSPGYTIRSALFSPDGKRIVAWGLDHTARIWEVPTGSPDSPSSEDPVIVLRGHEAAVSSAAFSADGTRLLTGSWDGTARMWDIVGYREQIASLKSVDDLVGFARTRVERQLSAEEKRKYLHE